MRDYSTNSGLRGKSSEMKLGGRGDLLSGWALVVLFSYRLYEQPYRRLSVPRVWNSQLI